MLGAKQYISEIYEGKLDGKGSHTGVVFWLKNNDDWVDKQETQITHKTSNSDVLDALEGEIVPNDTTSPLLEENTPKSPLNNE